MKKVMKKIVKTILPEWMIKNFIVQPLNAYNAYKNLRPLAPRKCNICNYEGYFGIMGRPPRVDASCPNCKSLERHRLMMLGINRGQIALNVDDNASVLHFAAEPILEKIFREKWKNYRTADLFREHDLKLNLEEIDLPDDSVDLIIANHILEHVDDEKASRELNRILVSNGILLCMVPIVEGWNSTYENESVKTDEQCWIHFGQGDHVRFYGRDFRDRIEKGGLRLINEITAEGTDVIEYGLVRGEKVFVFQKI